MILRESLRREIVAAIQAAPDKPLLLPDWAYGPDGRVIVVVRGLPMDLHRHLHDIMIRPLGYHEVMHDQSGIAGNVNPHLFLIRQDRKSPRTHCNKGHAYEGNEAPPNRRRYRCATCLRELMEGRRPETLITPTKERTHCPHGHEYTKKNTIRGKDKRRRCRTCVNARQRESMRRLRAATKPKEKP